MEISTDENKGATTHIAISEEASEKGYFSKLKTTNIISFIVIAVLATILIYYMVNTHFLFQSGKISSIEYERINNNILEKIFNIGLLVFGYYFGVKTKE